MLSSGQIRAARAMIDMSQIELSNITGIHYTTLQRIEKDDEGIQKAEYKTLKKIKDTLENKGIKFLNPSEKNSIDGIGIRYYPTTNKA
jgi:DNA-binding XRE family transcriptional regulator